MKRLFIVFAAMCSLSSCAVMFQGSRQSITVHSTTPDAKIFIDGEEAGTDAVTQKLARKENHTITVKKEGCETKTVEVQKELEWGWIVFDGLVNWFAFATDAPTGAWYSFDKDHYSVELVCPKAAPTVVPIQPATKQ